MAPLRSPLAGAVVTAVAAALLAGLTLAADAAVDAGPRIAADNARALLAAAVGATVTIGAFSFWMRPVAAQLVADELPPHMLAGRLYDDVQHRVTMLAVGVLTYEGLVIVALPENGADVPTLSVLIGGGIGVAGITGLLVAMHQAVHSTRPAAVLAEVARAVIDQIRAAEAARPGEDRMADDGTGVPTEEGGVILAEESGWIDHIDEDGLLAAVPEGTTVVVDAEAGSFVTQGWSRLASVWPPGLALDRFCRARVAACFHVADERGSGFDVKGGLDRLADIGVHAARGGSPSPSMIYAVLRRLAAVLHETLRHELRLPGRRGEGDRLLLRGEPYDHGDLVHVGVDRVRRVVAGDPAVAEVLICELVGLRREAALLDRQSAVAVLDEQIDLTVEQCTTGRPPAADLWRVEQARR